MEQLYTMMKKEEEKKKEKKKTRLYKHYPFF